MVAVFLPITGFAPSPMEDGLLGLAKARTYYDGHSFCHSWFARYSECSCLTVTWVLSSLMRGNSERFKYVAIVQKVFASPFKLFRQFWR